MQAIPVPSESPQWTTRFAFGEFENTGLGLTSLQLCPCVGPLLSAPFSEPESLLVSMSTFFVAFFTSAFCASDVADNAEGGSVRSSALSCCRLGGMDSVLKMASR